MRTILLTAAAAACIGIITSSTSKGAETDVIDDARACAAIGDPGPRFKCIDSISDKRKAARLAASQKVNLGSWRTKGDISPNDGSKSLTAMLAASSVTGGRSAALFVRCTDDNIDIYMSVDGAYFGSAETRNVLVSVGPQSTHPESWDSSENGKAIGLWTTAKDKTLPLEFTKTLLNNESPSLRLQVGSGSPVTASFDLTGIQRAITPVVSLCTLPHVVPPPPPAFKGTLFVPSATSDDPVARALSEGNKP